MFIRSGAKRGKLRDKKRGIMSEATRMITTHLRHGFAYFPTFVLRLPWHYGMIVRLRVLPDLGSFTWYYARVFLLCMPRFHCSQRSNEQLRERVSKLWHIGVTRKCFSLVFLRRYSRSAKGSPLPSVVQLHSRIGISRAIFGSKWSLVMASAQE
jgi:hypothetical protein